MIEIKKVLKYTVFILVLCFLTLYLRESAIFKQSNYPINLSPVQVSLDNQTILYAFKGFPQKINESNCICYVLLYVNYTKGECKEVALTCYVGNISKEIVVNPCRNNKKSTIKWESINIPCELEKECEDVECSFSLKGRIAIKK